MKYMAEQGLISTEVDEKTGKKTYSVRKWFENRTSRFVEFYIGKLAECRDPIDDIDEIESGKQAQSQWEQQGFTEVSDGNEELPF